MAPYRNGRTKQNRKHESGKTLSSLDGDGWMVSCAAVAAAAPDAVVINPTQG